jgi:phosphatidylserine decarboxylase
MIAGAWLKLWQHLVPKALVSRIVYHATRSRRGWLRGPLIRWFVAAYRVDMSEAETADVGAYATFNEFFTRTLAPGARPIAAGSDTLVAPADGVLTAFGAIEGTRLLQAKGRHYSLAELLGETGAAVDALCDGAYFTIYLAPRDYHRVHAPLTAALTRTRYLPGERFSVSRATAAIIPRLFCRNERVVCWFDAPSGPLVVVLVGALNVSSLGTFTRGEIASGAAHEWREQPPRSAEKGAEIGRFNMGSTVIVLLGAHVAFVPDAIEGAALRMGQALGHIAAP